ncbi:MAG: glycine cleavage system aminomethyltransferase GcvT [Candidatus Eisenbacteria bacterium]|nr:glycine cleavage system aminomethyltransferase GcvT [Candidatus Eisenbacteria bacterium]
MLRRTPLWANHREGGAKMVGFAGWEMPIQYPTGQLEEHRIVRTDAGVFDVSHMGRFRFGGPGAHSYVQKLITNDFEKAAVGQVLYAALCDESGGIIDDVTAYKLEDGCLLVVNASNRKPDWDWIASHKPADVTLVDESDAIAQLAVQGPRAQERFSPLVSGDLDPIGYYRYGRFTVLGVPDVLISRNGYTGEDGFEIYLPAEGASDLWKALLERGVRPIGLGARDTLRFEMGYALYGNELDRETTPLEAGIGWTVKLKKPDFFGKEPLLRLKEKGLPKTIAGFEVEGVRMPRHGQTILHEGRAVGKVTSGGPCPSLGNKGMGLGYVPPDLAAVGTRLSIDVRGTSVPAVVVERPFYKNASHR